jgi:phage replication O-like protein O
MGLSTQRAFDAPNYTQAPNAFFDLLVVEIDTLAELKVTLAIIRATFGWHKDEDELSFTQLEERTGLSRQSVNDGVGAALERGYVQRRKQGRSFLYRLEVKNLDSREGRPSDGQAPRPMDDDAVPGGSVNDLDPQKKGTTSKEKGKEITRPEVERLCQLMADLSNARTDPEGNRSSPKYTVTKTWRDEMRRLIDIDGRPPELIERAIRWVDQHDFWRKNILAVPKLREQFDRIFLEAQQQKGRSGGGRGGKADRVQGNIEAMREAAEG